MNFNIGKTHLVSFACSNRFFCSWYKINLFDLDFDSDVEVVFLCWNGFKPRFVLWSSCLLRLHFIFMNLPSEFVYCCHVWAGTPNLNWDILSKLQKWVCCAAISTLISWPLALYQILKRPRLFFRYCSWRYKYEVPELFHLPCSREFLCLHS